jgi:DNA-directed RNA polymerase specialized sigma24 family protein
LSYEQIAAITETNVVNARTRVFRAKQKLKDILKPYIKDLEQH